MLATDFKNKNIVIWGMGREGKAAAAFIRNRLPQQSLTFVDENRDAAANETVHDIDQFITDAAQIEAALNKADIVIKSPGVSLYHPFIQNLKQNNIPITSLLNLWAAEPHAKTTIGITGTKGKSTTTALLTHVLTSLGKKAAAAGNIGVPVTEIADAYLDFAVIEVSSYQAANFFGMFDIGVLTSLYPDHLDWHKSLAAYFRDKLNLLIHSGVRIINQDALETLRQYNLDPGPVTVFNHPSGFHVKDGDIFDGNKELGVLQNEHLSRPHNLINVCNVLTVIRYLHFDTKQALLAMESYCGLPHRQQELGMKDGLMFVDDSISTTPQSSIAALEAYAGKTVTLIAGGYDRGVDYNPLIYHILRKKIHTVICLGPSGQRIYDGLKKGGASHIYMSASMPETVEMAKKLTPAGGVVLLSPGAPSYGMFQNFEERGKAFAACAESSSQT